MAEMDYVRKSAATPITVKGEKRLTASEREALIRLNVASAILLDAPTELQERMALIPFGKRDLAMMRKKIDAVMRQVKQTIPEEQRSIYDNSLRMTSWTTGVRGPGGSADREKEYGMWLPYEVINALLEGCHDHCLMCDLDKYACRKCAIKKALDAIPNDTPEDTGLPCKYRSVM